MQIAHQLTKREQFRQEELYDNAKILRMSDIHNLAQWNKIFIPL